MKATRRTVASLVLLFSAARAIASAAGDATNKPTPELVAFGKAWVALQSYTDITVAHELTNDGKSVQDRTYRFKFLKPHDMAIEIMAGPGRGSAAVWHGGDTVRGHQGGFFSHIHLTIPKTDKRVLSLRGDQIDAATFGYEYEHFLRTPGSLEERKDAQGRAIVMLTPTVAEPTGITREELVFDPTTHMPVEHTAYVGTMVVKHETFSQLVIDGGLTEKDIDNT